MEIVKKNIVSIILGVVALLAVAASFYPLSGFMTELQTKLTARQAQYTKASELVKRHHTLPVPDPADTTTRDLPVFPEKKITADAKALMGSLVDDSKGVFNAAMQLNVAECALHPTEQTLPAKMLLVQGSLPDLRGNLNIEFKNAVPGEIERMRTQILNGGFPPSTDEMTIATNELNAKFDKEIMRGADNQPINGPEVEARRADALAKLSDQLRNKVSQMHSMYVDPTAIPVPADLLPTVATPPTQERMYYVQAGLWAEEDICHAIAEVNAKASDTSNAVVKRLLHLDVQSSQAMYLRPTPATGAAAATPTVMTSDIINNSTFTRGGYAGAVVGAPNNEPPPEKPDYSMSVTGRYCNKFYDVVNVSLDVHVDATRLPAFLASLSRNRLVTVRNIESLSRVDNNDLLAQSFIYGTVPVADVRLDIEELQMREWTVPFMPQPVRAFLIGPIEWKPELSAPSTPQAPGTTAATPVAIPASPPVTPTLPPPSTPVNAPRPPAAPNPAAGAGPREGH